MAVPAEPKIYHIVHLDRLASIISDGYLWCDSESLKRSVGGTTIGMQTIKARRLSLPLTTHPGLNVGDCVPFYFCPRSVMLFLIDRANDSELTYRGGQEPIIHLEADFNETVAWAKQNKKRWSFTLMNAANRLFEDRSDLGLLSEINWEAVRSTQWSGTGIPSSVKEGKQAEFLMEFSFPWALVSRIGVFSRNIYFQVRTILRSAHQKQCLEIKREWYY